MLSANPITSKKLNQLVWQVFTKSYGLTLQSEAASFLADKISNYSMNEAQTNEFLNYMAQNYSKISKDRSGMVSKANIEVVFNQVYQSQDNKDTSKALDVRNYIRVLNTTDIPKYEYDVHSKVFNKISSKSNVFYTEATDKIAFSQRRYNIVKQRIIKQFRSSSDSSKITLTPIKSIKGINSPSLERVLFGQITEMTEGEFYLEDPEEFIPLDFSAIKEKISSFVTEGSLVLIKGTCLGNKFLVKSISAPPCELRSETLSMLTHPDNTEATNFAEPMHELIEMETKAKNSRFVILSDVWLDQPKVLERLKMLFEGFNAQGNLPELFILMGPFSSNPPKDGPRAWSHYQDIFDGFSVFIERIKNVRNCKFVFVPSCTDPGFVDSVYPRPPIPDPIFDAWKRAKLDFVSASNPCRIVYFSQEIVVLRQEVTQKLRSISMNSRLNSIYEKNKILNEEEEEDVEPAKALPDFQMALQSCLNQSTMSPYSIANQTVLWDSGSALSLYPIPTAFIVAERQNCYEFSYEGCKCGNPGSFPSSEGSFLLYNPAKKTLDLCEMPK